MVIIIEKLFITGAGYFSFKTRLSHRNQVWLDHLPEYAAIIWWSFIAFQIKNVLKISFVFYNLHYLYCCNFQKSGWSGSQLLCSIILKGPLLILKQFLTIKNPLKMMKNAFYFMLKTLFVPEIFKFLSWLFGYEEKMLEEQSFVDVFQNSCS